MKLIGISLGAAVLSALLWAMLWFWGQGLTYKPYDHPLMNWAPSEGKPLLALSTNNFNEAQDFLEKNPDGILYLNLKVSSTGEFFTAQPSDLSFIAQILEKDFSHYKGSKHYYYDFNFLKASTPSLLSAEAWLELKPLFWILNIEDNALDVDQNLVAWVEKNNLQNKVVIVSDIDLVLGSLKDRRPLWVYGSSVSDLTKLLTMASIHLETLVSLKRDYFFTPVKIKNRSVLNPKVIQEVKKRFKKVAIGPVHTDLDRVKALELQPDILILTSTIIK